MAMKKVGEMLNFSSEKTAKINKRFDRKSSRYSMYKDTSATLNAGINLRDIVMLPEGEDFDDFLAMHVKDFYDRIKLVYMQIYADDKGFKTRY